MQQRGQHQRAGVDFGLVPRAHEEHAREADEGERRQMRASELGMMLAHHRREKHGEDAERRGHEARIDGAVAQVLLHPLRQQHEVGEEHAVGDRDRDRAAQEIALLEQAQIDDRIFFGQLPDQEERETDQRDDAESARSPAT